MEAIQSVQDEVQRSPELRLEDVSSLREWTKTQPHLPNIDIDVLLALFLRRRHYDLEKAKHTLDNYLTFRTEVPEMAIHRNTQRQEVQTFFRIYHIILFDKRDSHGNLICFVDLHDPDPRKFDLESSIKTGMATIEAWCLENGNISGITVIFDQKQCSLSHLGRLSLSALTKMNYYNKHCAPASMKSIYIINANKISEKALLILKPILHAELFNRIKIFTKSQMDQFYQYFPKETLPNEYGGNAGSLASLNEKTLTRFERHQHLFQEIDHLKVDESRRPKEKTRKPALFRLRKSFKKLNID